VPPQRLLSAWALSAYGLWVDAIEMVDRRLDGHGMTKRSEHGDVTRTVSRRILQATL
jgi:alcohol dehydrogenase YqhD (iron-dependent ADH family)